MAALYNVRLTKQHMHNGTRHPAGKVLTVDKRIADWLVEQSVGVMLGAAAAGVPATPRAPAPRPSGGCCGWR